MLCIWNCDGFTNIALVNVFETLSNFEIALIRALLYDTCGEPPATCTVSTYLKNYPGRLPILFFMCPGRSLYRSSWILEMTLTLYIIPTIYGQWDLSRLWDLSHTITWPAISFRQPRAVMRRVCQIFSSDQFTSHFPFHSSRRKSLKSLGSYQIIYYLLCGWRELSFDASSFLALS